MKKALLVSIAVITLAASGFAQHQIVSVADVSLRNQTGNIGGTLYTPTVTGVFRLTVYMQCTGASENGQGQGLFPQFNYTDDNGPDFAQIPQALDGQPSQPTSWTGVIKSKAGTPITWAIDVATGDTSIYEVYILLERVGPPESSKKSH